MHSRTWYVAFQAVVRAESPSLHDTAARIASDIVGDVHRHALDAKQAELDIANDLVRDLEHELAARLAPAGVLAEAESLLREAEALCVGLSEGDCVELTWWVDGGGEDAWESATHPTLAEAYAALTQETP